MFVSFDVERPLQDPGLLHRVLATSASDAREDVIDTALERLGVAADHAVLELGCGTGDILSRIAARLLHGIVVGVDTSDVMLGHARRRNRVFLERGRADVQRIDCGSLAPLDDGTFDRVLGVHVVYFWSDPPRQVEEIRRVLRPGGRLVLAFRPRAEGRGPGRDPATDPREVEDWFRSGGFDAFEEGRTGSGRRPLHWLGARRV